MIEVPVDHKIIRPYDDFAMTFDDSSMNARWLSHDFPLTVRWVSDYWSFCGPWSLTLGLALAGRAKRNKICSIGRKGKKPRRHCHIELLAALDCSLD